MDPMPIDALERMRICGRCAQLNGAPVGPDFARDIRDQRCRCRRTEEPKWPRFDFNEHVHLCECCLQEALPSGSKFSTWFCDPCRALVTALNDDLRVWLIPTGRHSFMVRTYTPPGVLMLSGGEASHPDESRKRAAVDRFARGVLGMVSSIDRLEEWSRASLLQNLQELSSRRTLKSRWPSTLGWSAPGRRDPRCSKEAEFGRLRQHMLAGRIPSG
jgi:hypothetical protein